MPALEGGCAGPGRVEAARWGLSRPWEGRGRQEAAVPALGGYRSSGGGCGGRLQAFRRGLCRPWEGAGRQEGAVPALVEYSPPGGVCAGPGEVQGHLNHSWNK